MNKKFFRGEVRCYFHAHRANIEGWYYKSAVNVKDVADFFKYLLNYCRKHGAKSLSSMAQPITVYYVCFVFNKKSVNLLYKLCFCRNKTVIKLKNLQRIHAKYRQDRQASQNPKFLSRRQVHNLILRKQKLQIGIQIFVKKGLSFRHKIQSDKFFLLICLSQFCFKLAIILRTITIFYHIIHCDRY